MTEAVRKSEFVVVWPEALKRSPSVHPTLPRATRQINDVRWNRPAGEPWTEPRILRRVWSLLEERVIQEGGDLD